MKPEPSRPADPAPTPGRPGLRAWLPVALLAALLAGGCGPGGTEGGGEPPTATGQSAAPSAGTPTPTESTGDDAVLEALVASGDSAAIFDRATERMRAGQTNAAVAALRAGLKVNADDEEGWFNLGFLLTRQGDMAGAEAAYRECLRVLPEYAEAHNNLGNLLRRQGRFDEAVAEFELALRNSDANSSAHNNLGSALAGMGRTAEAIPHFVQATVLNPGYTEAWINLSTAYQQQGRLQEAVTPIENALRLEPGSESARRVAARLRQRLALERR